MAHGTGADPRRGRPVPVHGGLTGAEAAERLRRNGRNLPPGPWRTLPFLLLAGEFTHVFALLLWSAAALALVGGLPGAALAVAAVVAVSGCLAFVQDYWADLTGRRILARLPATATAVRDGRLVRVPAAELVVNDVVLLAAGDRVPADLRLTEAHGLAVDETPLTGRRTVAHPGDGDTVFAGTHVVAGSGEGIVAATGPRTRIGQDASPFRQARPPSGPLTGDLRDLTAFAAGAAAGACLLLFLVLSALGVPPAESFLPCTALAVALVPLGLRPAAHLSLARCARRIARAGAAARRTEAVEQLGAVTVLCVHRAVLTGGAPAPAEVWTPQGFVRVTGEGWAPDGGLVGDAPAVAAASDLALSAALCSGGGFCHADGRWQPVGDPVEAACHVLAARAGADVSLSAVETRHPFDPYRRRASAFAQGAVHVKGAPEAVLPRCRAAPGAGAALADMAERGLRVLAVARRDLTAPPERADDAERDLTLLGLVGLADAPRADTRAAVARCRRAGLRMVLVTGEEPRAAQAAARAAGLARSGAPVLTGAQLPDDLRGIGELLDRDGAVVARASPEDRRRVTVALQHRGHTVATSGGGPADAAALRRADVGVAAGVSGTDAARDAADLVLLDDGLAGLAEAVELGRAARAGLRRILAYRLAGSVAVAAPLLVWALTGGAVPPALGLFQVLAATAVLDLLPALALGSEPPERHAARGREPSVPPLLDRPLAVRAAGMLGTVAAAVVLLAFGTVLWVGGWQWGRTPAPLLLAQASGAAFATVVLGRAATLLACRSETRPFDAAPWRGNPLLPGALAVQLLLLWACLAVPVLAGLLDGTVPPGFVWPAVACVVPAVLAADTVHKVVREGREAG
ncbi:P-type ATPase [Thermobifida cellulosilytica]|uniref:Cation-transporting ATPase n=1 Tax=Thermobifida cellulosilytica TB100 TaxID=665004 RepID=A0A147KJI5_THECS|nr:cation transporting ATPase C-terminal domain-containing protein [Thermobifida cellulosilytica]KUP97447.1 cation-transporting ATPase [Thermobifida cellulosilytica TB100]